MERVNFTAGPWAVESPMGDGPGDVLWIVEAGKPTYDWRPIATVCSCDPENDDGLPKITIEEREANARLIVAAPDLDKALLDLAQAVATTSMPVAAQERLLPFVEAAKVALDKVRCQQVAA